MNSLQENRRAAQGRAQPKRTRELHLPSSPPLFEKPSEVVWGLEPYCVVDGALQVMWLKLWMWLILETEKTPRVPSGV